MGGVSVGSWVFDPEEFSEMKRAIALEEEKEGGRRKRPEKIVEREVEDDEEDYRTTPLQQSPHLSPVHTPPSSAHAHAALLPTLSSLSSSSAPTNSTAAAPSFTSASSHIPINPRKQSHGRFLVTDHILDPPQLHSDPPSSAHLSTASSSSSSHPYPTSDVPHTLAGSAPMVSSPLVGGGESVASVYAAMAAGGGPTLTHSRVGRFAVTDEQHL